jgi:hypothetical protein
VRDGRRFVIQLAALGRRVQGLFRTGDAVDFEERRMFPSAAADQFLDLNGVVIA